MKMEKFLEVVELYKEKIISREYGEVFAGEAIYMIAKTEGQQFRFLYKFRPPILINTDVTWDKDDLPYLKETYLIDKEQITVPYYVTLTSNYTPTTKQKNYFLRAVQTFPSKSQYKKDFDKVCELIKDFVNLRDNFIEENKLTELQKDLIEQYFGAADLWNMSIPEDSPGELLNELALLTFLAEVDCDKLLKKASTENKKRQSFLQKHYEERKQQVTELLKQNNFIEMDIQTAYQEALKENKEIEAND